MEGLDLENGTYRSPPRRLSVFARCFPTLRHYASFLPVVFRAARKAKRGRYDDEAWVQSSHDVRNACEAAGIRISFDGLSNVAALDGPCVFVGNHMSMLETVVLPGFIQPLRPMTFVVKQSLIEYPVFKHIMKSRDPVVVTRTDPRADFKTMMKGGQRRLAEDRSLVIFPQTTRTTTFDRREFNTIGVKLALRAGVPLVPIALRTDAWRLAKYFIKDLGRVFPSVPVNFAIGEPITVTGRGTEAHERVLAFIEDHLERWGLPPVRERDEPT